MALFGTRRYQTVRIVDGLPTQELLEVERYFSERFVHHSQPDNVVCGHAEQQAEKGQSEELVAHGTAVHAQIPEQQFWVFVVTVHIFFLFAVHVRPAVAVQRRGYTDQSVPQETGGHQRLHNRFDDQPVAHAVHRQREHGRHNRRCQHSTGLKTHFGILLLAFDLRLKFVYIIFTVFYLPIKNKNVYFSNCTAKHCLLRFWSPWS